MHSSGLMITYGELKRCGKKPSRPTLSHYSNICITQSKSPRTPQNTQPQGLESNPGRYKHDYYEITSKDKKPHDTFLRYSQSTLWYGWNRTLSFHMVRLVYSHWRWFHKRHTQEPVQDKGCTIIVMKMVILSRGVENRITGRSWWMEQIEKKPSTLGFRVREFCSRTWELLQAVLKLWVSDQFSRLDSLWVHEDDIWRTKVSPQANMLPNMWAPAALKLRDWDQLFELVYSEYIPTNVTIMYV
jgi:hypothetical protein